MSLAHALSATPILPFCKSSVISRGQTEWRNKHIVHPVGTPVDFSFSLERIAACVQGEEWMDVVTEAVGGVREGHMGGG